MFGFGGLLSALAGMGQPLSRDQLIRQHNAAVEDIAKFLSTRGHQVHFTNTRLAKPANFGTPPALSSCSPMLCNELQLGAVHKGHVLTGTLIVDALLMSSVQTVLEDEEGNVVKVHIYNTPQLRRCTPAGRPADITAAQRVFPKGQRIGIIEPFYKVMMDGTLGVRVDNPAEVVFLDESGCPRASSSNSSSSSRSPASTPANNASAAAEPGDALIAGHGSGSLPPAAAVGTSAKPHKPTTNSRPNKKKGKGRKK